MGVGIYPCFRPHIPEAAFDCDGKVLLAEYEFLDEIAFELGLAPLSSFGDNRPIPEDFDGNPDELTTILGPWDEWFAIHDGAKTVDGLIEALSNGAIRRNKSPHCAIIIVELQELQRCFQAALEKQVMFRFEVS